MSDTPATWKKPHPPMLTRIGWILVLAGAVSYILGYTTDPRHAVFVNVVNYLFLTSVALGALFLVALEYLAGAVWSVPMRRVSEFLAGLLPFAALLAIPAFFHLHEIFRWTHADAMLEDAALALKEPYLNVNFFTLRFVLIFGLWILAFALFTYHSRKQDTDRDQKHTHFNIGLSAAFMPVFGIGLTVLAIDWGMSLEADWYSTIYGVYFFAGIVLAGVAAATYGIVLLQEHRYLPELRRDHLYSLGTLMFVFINFWAYIAFSQFLLIWYANLPEETTWFLARWHNGWEYVSIALILMKFAVPYFALLAQDAKMEPRRLKFMALWLLVAQMLDLYWLIMPTYSAAPILGWMEIAFPLLSVGLAIVVVGWNMKRHSLVPVGDPKLQRGLDFHI